MDAHDSPDEQVLALPLDSADASLARCGGKGLNLTRLVRAGFSVPPGFVLVTDAYRRFVTANDLAPRIVEACRGLDASDATALAAASASIRAAFSASSLPPEIAEAVRAAWRRVFARDAAVAVRSSATAEDLPDLSFAGQLDTFLNVVGVEAALGSVVDCWSSLWTAHAIGYRLRNNVPDTDVALAVVVQTLVPAEVSGVLFTANPLTGARGEVVIDATFGLGEALVSGQVEPDHLVVETTTGTITRSPGAKSVATKLVAGGGVETAVRDGGDRPTLTDAQARELAEVGRAVAAALGAPQDIEWTISQGAIQLVQARPITSLFPLPAGEPDAVWFSFGAVQGMLQPMTPLGRDAINLVLSGLAQLLARGVDLGTAGYLRPAGERLWIRLDRMLRHPWGARLLPRLAPVVEPSAAAILHDLARERGWTRPAGRPSAASVRAAARLASRVVPRAPATLADPTARRLVAQSRIDRFVNRAAERLRQASAVADDGDRLAARLGVLRGTLGSVAQVFAAVAPVMVPAAVLMAAVTVAAARAGEPGRVLALEVLRGVPGNVTTEMDLALWRAAATIKVDPCSLTAFETTEVEQLAELLAAGQLPNVAQDALAGFLARYGMRGVAEIDLGQPRWRENPIDVLRSLQSYLQITDPERAPDVMFARGAAAAQRAALELAALISPGHGVRARLQAARWRFAIDRVRKLIGIRETPKFTVVRLFGDLRQALLASGYDLVAAGVLERADDVFFLHVDELERLPGEPAEPWRAVVAARRQVNEREGLRRQVPRILLGDGRAFYEGMTGHDDAISGSPVSPGVVEGTVRVVLDPQASHLLPGEILVCPGTDPAWTPLFLTAGGLVTEVGGMMTHGSVVAREYGIPAIVGVHEATSRLTTGQRIRLDGTTGTIEILNEPTG